jgi:protein phosphatase 1L
MTCTPDVSHWVLHPKYDRFAIFATDGVWGVMSDQQAVDVVADELAKVCARVCLCVCVCLCG